MIVNLGPLKANLESNRRSIGEALAELDREINLRIRMYPDWIKSRKLSALDAVDRLERMAKGAQTLQALLDGKLDEVSTELEAQQALDRADAANEARTEPNEP